MSHLDPIISDFVPFELIEELIEFAKSEDLGDPPRDVTSELLIAEAQQAEVSIVAREPGVICGTGVVLPMITAAYSHDAKTIQYWELASAGSPIETGQTVARFQGPLRTLLALERVALNFMCHLSGIATLTARYVEQTHGTKARIYDTRKTLPGLRGLQKYAVACGGGATHRVGLYDAMLIKDNHLAHHPLRDLTAAVSDAVARARKTYPDLKFIEVEVDTLDQLGKVLDTGIDIVLLDNMSPKHLSKAVAMRDDAAPRVLLEASGGVTLDTVRAIAETGVDRISVGALTHSAPSLDLGLDIA